MNTLAITRLGILGLLCSCTLPREDIRDPDPTPPGIVLMLIGDEGTLASVSTGDPPANATISVDKDYRLLALAADGNAGIEQVRIGGEVNVHCTAPGGLAQSVWAIYAKAKPEVPGTPGPEVPTLAGVDLDLKGAGLKSLCSSGFKFGKVTGGFSASADSWGGASAQTPILWISSP